MRIKEVDENIKVKSELMMEKRQKFIIEQLNPHEKEMRDFILEVINKYNITNLAEWYEYEYLFPSCSSKLLMEIHFEKLLKENKEGSSNHE